jgi:O-antigen/teichoic acid export membrane protein
LVRFLNVPLVRRIVPRFLRALNQPGLLRRFAGGVSLTFGIQIAGVFLAYVTQVLLARWMGAAEYGKYTYVLSWATLLAVLAGLGLSTSVLRFIPEYMAQKQPGLLRGMIRRSWQLTLGAGIVIALLGGAVASWIAPPEYSASLMLGVWMVPLIALMTLYQGTSRALRRVAMAFAPPLVMRPLLLAIGVFVLFLVGEDVDSRQVLGVALGTLSVVILVQWLAQRKDVSSRIAEAKPQYDDREWSRVSGPLLVSSGFGTLTAQVGILMVGSVVSPGAVGIYSAAVKTTMLISLIIIAVNTFASPEFASLYSQGKREELQRLLNVAANMMFWPALAIAILLIAFSGIVLGLFGEEFVAGRAAMAVLTVGLLVSAGSGPVGRLTDLTGHHRQSMWVRGYGSFLTILLSAALIPLWGILGAAIASSSGLILTNVWLHRLASRNLGLTCSILFAFSRSRETGA